MRVACRCSLRAALRRGVQELSAIPDASANMLVQRFVDVWTIDRHRFDVGMCASIASTRMQRRRGADAPAPTAGSVAAASDHRWYPCAPHRRVRTGGMGSAFPSVAETNPAEFRRSDPCEDPAPRWACAPHPSLRPAPRSYVVLTSVSPLRLFVYDDWLVRVCKKPFDGSAGNFLRDPDT